MEERIISFLNRHYTIVDNKFIYSDGRHEWGKDLAYQLSVIFSLSDEVCSSILKNWSINYGMSDEEIVVAWSRPALNIAELPNIIPYEPKRKDRFTLTFPANLEIQEWGIKQASRPSFYVKNYKILGVTFYKKIIWVPISIIFRDPIGPSTSQKLFKLIQNNSVKEISFEINMVDPTGIVIEKWNVNKCSILSIDFGELNYEKDHLIECKLVVKPKSVKLQY